MVPSGSLLALLRRVTHQFAWPLCCALCGSAGMDEVKKVWANEAIWPSTKMKILSAFEEKVVEIFSDDNVLC